MSEERIVVLELTRIEAAHLGGLVDQFAELLEETDSIQGDPAILRLVPDAYPDDDEASREFRDVTESDLLARRRADAACVTATLGSAATLPVDVDPSDGALIDTVDIALAPVELSAWLRCLAALRLVLAERLGIRSEDDHDQEDPRFGVYEWLGFRLDGLVQAASLDS